MTTISKGLMNDKMYKMYLNIGVRRSALMHLRHDAQSIPLFVTKVLQIYTYALQFIEVLLDLQD